MTVSLPARDTQEGAVVRLLLLEVRGPWSRNYDEADSRTAMQWMKGVLQNRLDDDPAQFGAPGAHDLIDIIRAREQFSGFSAYPAYRADLIARLRAIVDIANNPQDTRSAGYIRFVDDALAVARAPVVAEPGPALYAWRAVGTGSPGSRFVPYRNLAGNTFFALAR